MKILNTVVVFVCLLSVIAFAQAKYEPDSSCYIGAFIVYDQIAQGNVQAFEKAVGKKHSMYFSYTSYGSPFPADWVSDYASSGVTVQIAFEPNNGLNEVVDGDYIREWARAAHKSGAAIFLRWACEMNGSWVAWYGNPQLYIQKYKLIHDIMKEEAPNVTMVWAPNNIPNEPNNPPNSIQAYYPGDDYVDWVGIDFYGVYISEGLPDTTDPRSKLRVVYDVYSNRKPIMICEWAAAHYTYRTTPNKSITGYAIAQMDSLYLNLKTQFPRFKAVNWFSVNSQTSNQCDFCLTDDAAVLNNYKKDISSDYFRTTPFRNVPLVEFNGIDGDTVIYSDINISPKITCDVQIDSVVLYVNNKRAYLYSQDNSPYNFTIADKTDGIYSVKVTAYAKSGYSNFADCNFIVDKAHNYVNQVIDDNSSSVSYTGTWVLSNSQADRYGTSYRYCTAGDGTSKATWKPSISNAGYYNVYAWWSEHENRASNAPYIIDGSNYSDTVKVNQQQNGGKWNFLGKYYFEAGNSGKVTLTNNANGIVIADAVRFEYAYPTDVKQRNNTPAFQLMQNYPNPFNPSTRIMYKLKDRAFVELKVYDVLGRIVATLVNQEKPAGEYTVEFNPKGKKSSLASGIYYYTLRAGNYFESRKMILAK